ncbi:unnamed protein product [Cuscuta campestris]|uniref:Cystatin domain-containing protein n=1 Tax=Cuscuta campestris TaxID=132261 RepID=A0A484L589_9ASTE|nr:unnamed protein product [Cuscuta campestris]
MEKIRLNICLILFSLLLTLAAAALGGGGKVGGRKEIKDVENNKEIQNLGLYCVKAKNDLLKKETPGTPPLVFFKVVHAEEQVVAGIKYFLRISAGDGDGKVRIFDAEVVVQPWAKSKKLISFVPSGRSK